MAMLTVTMRFYFRVSTVHIFSYGKTASTVLAHPWNHDNYDYHKLLQVWIVQG
jgi:hypothetical protein